MITFDWAREVLTEIADALPRPIFNDLNGGVILLPDIVHDGDGLLILGQYHVDPMGFGRYVTINYGSLTEAYGHLPPHIFEKKLKDVLCHELLHHLESLSGERSLEIQDEIDKARMLRGNHG